MIENDCVKTTALAIVRQILIAGKSPDLS